VREGVLLNDGKGYVREFDIVAAESTNNDLPPQTWYFEVKKRPLISIDVIDSIAGKYDELQKSGASAFCSYHVWQFHTSRFASSSGRRNRIMGCIHACQIGNTGCNRAIFC
jgi:hypothetical protein